LNEPPLSPLVAGLITQVPANLRVLTKAGDYEVWPPVLVARRPGDPLPPPWHTVPTPALPVRRAKVRSGLPLRALLEAQPREARSTTDQLAESPPKLSPYEALALS